MIYYFVLKLRRQVWNILDLDLSQSKAPKASDYQKCKRQTTFFNIHNSTSFVGQIIRF